MQSQLRALTEVVLAAQRAKKVVLAAADEEALATETAVGAAVLQVAVEVVGHLATGREDHHLW